MDTGIVFFQSPLDQLPQVLVHVLREEGSEGCHHPHHGVDHREQGLERFQTFLITKLTLREKEGEREGGGREGRGPEK